MRNTRRTRSETVDDPRHSYLPGAGHDLLLPLYDSVQKWLGIPRLHQTLIDLADLTGSARTLEIGCGTGNLAILAKRLHPATEVVGIDPDPRALARAGRKAGPALAVGFDQGYGQELPYPDASFDRVLSAFMFHHLDPEVKRRTLQEVLRVLEPGGGLHMVDFGGRVAASDGRMARLQLRSHRLRANMGDGIPRLLRDAGFADVAESAHRTSRVGRVTYYRALAPAVLSTP
ncbi:class I SAM-dependent methyltransferase [Pseudonocardia sp. H11422]|uniref:class I SAM-dependent methyltransferase n=1 Tax=Pseudonocardia sp. H11422 TaxID=2835866 RepID=UPI001BDD3C5F|nr:methyltransferase domain-containing protein [Pseudonocardia sp. H11422]